jgi:hypothetical protein
MVGLLPEAVDSRRFSTRLPPVYPNTVHLAQVQKFREKNGSGNSAKADLGEKFGLHFRLRGQDCLRLFQAPQSLRKLQTRAVQ